MNPKQLVSDGSLEKEFILPLPDDGFEHEIDESNSMQEM
jgi:hypothetical protein